MWAVREDGTWRGIDPEIKLDADEVLYEELPNWAFEAQVAQQLLREASSAEVSWQQEEIINIDNQLMAIEEYQAGIDGVVLLPGSRVDWLEYRSKIRLWKIGGNAEYPKVASRPKRPLADN